MALSFYDIDKDYVKYLQKEEMNERGFTKVPNIEYPGNLPKFTCGVVLDVHEYKYYVPVSSYKMQKPDNILINIESERYNKVKGALRFNYMFPVPDECINLEWKFCNENEIRIRNKAKQTYSKVINKVNPSIVNNSCDFKLLERLCAEYQK